MCCLNVAMRRNPLIREKKVFPNLRIRASPSIVECVDPLLHGTKFPTSGPYDAETHRLSGIATSGSHRMPAAAVGCNSDWKTSEYEHQAQMDGVCEQVLGLNLQEVMGI